ncbi:MAG TPA: VWA domain-containing protein [Pyrinomonadaceae bacterium]
MLSRKLLSITIAILTSVATVGAQTPVRQQNPDTISVSTAEVRVDVVVRDKKGHAIKDLNNSDFEVFEDGVKQDISSFRFVGAADPVKTAAPNTAAENTPGQPADISTPGTTNTASSPTGVTAVAFVFDRLSPESRRRATDAAKSYLESSVDKNELTGVFVTDLSVAVLQPYTNNHELAKAGIEKLTGYAPSAFNSNSSRIQADRQALSGTLITKASDANFKDMGPATHQLELELRTLERWEEFQRDQQGDATARGLLFVASSLRSLPGRKAVIFFSEGLVLPTSVMESFNAVINQANRNNVSFYAIDAAGLRTESKTAATNREINSQSELRMAQQAAGTEVMGPMSKDLERNEDALRQNPDSGLGRLANETGGFLITDSNDLKGRLQSVDEDLHSYYLMSYASKNANYDGHFRKIEVKVKRSSVNVQSRKGYYAIKNTFSTPIMNYEVPALAALENAPKANSFSFYPGAFNFPEPDRTGLVPVIVDFPLSPFTFRLDQTKKVYNTDFSIVALIKDESGQVVDKLSSQYRLNGAADKVEETKHTRALFYRETELAPGHYTMDVIAYDAPSGVSSVRTSTLEVADNGDDKLRLSDVTIISRGESANGADQQRSNPFHVGDVMVSPNLGETIKRSALKQVPFYFTVYVSAGSTAKPKLMIELQRDGKAVLQLPGELPAADALGRIQFIAALPVDKVPAGAYALKITVSNDTTNVTTTRHFTVED